jgi:hypothetical protein
VESVDAERSLMRVGSVSSGEDTGDAEEDWELRFDERIDVTIPPVPVRPNEGVRDSRSELGVLSCPPVCA